MTVVRPLRMALAGLFIACCPWSAAGTETDITGEAGSDAYEIIGEQANEASSAVDQAASEHGGSDGGPILVEYRWVSACSSPDRGGDPSAVLDCAAARACPDPAERVWRLWGRTAAPSTWALLGAQCFGTPPTAEDAPEITITPGMVLNEIRRIGLPALQAKTQPADKTLVNFATIFYTEPEPFTRSVRLLGQSVDVEATPSQFTWHHGDGTTSTTNGPGAPYPSKEITHSYTRAQVTVAPRVDVTYTARFRVNGGAWQDISETVTIQGPASSLRISEAAAVLSGSYTQ